MRLFGVGLQVCTGINSPRLQAELAKQRELNARMRHELTEQAAAAEEAAAKEEDEAGQLAAAQVRAGCWRTCSV